MKYLVILIFIFFSCPTLSKETATLVALNKRIEFVFPLGYCDDTDTEAGKFILSYIQENLVGTKTDLRAQLSFIKCDSLEPYPHGYVATSTHKANGTQKMFNSAFMNITNQEVYDETIKDTLDYLSKERYFDTETLSTPKIVWVDDKFGFISIQRMKGVMFGEKIDELIYILGLVRQNRVINVYISELYGQHNTTETIKALIYTAKEIR